MFRQGGAILRDFFRHHHHVHEVLGVFTVPWSSKWSWSFHLFFGRPMFCLPSGLYFSACLASLFVSILCTCCSHFFWYCFISITMFYAPVFPLIHWFFSLSNFVIPSKFLKNFICAASKGCMVILSIGLLLPFEDFTSIVCCPLDRLPAWDSFRSKE